MIPVGTLCIIVSEPRQCEPPALSGHVGTVAPVRTGQALLVKCNLVLQNGMSASVWEWAALRPITPPEPDSTTNRDKELEST